MIQTIKNSIAYGKELLEKCLSIPDWNSRLVFLGQSAISAVAVLVLTIGFLHAKSPELYPEMVLAVGGVFTGTVAAGRYFTKKAGAPVDPPAAGPQ